MRNLARAQPQRNPARKVKDEGFYLAPQADWGGGKVGILILDFHFSTVPIEAFAFDLLFLIGTG